MRSLRLQLRPAGKREFCDPAYADLDHIQTCLVSCQEHNRYFMDWKKIKAKNGPETTRTCLAMDGRVKQSEQNLGFPNINAGIGKWGILCQSCSAQLTLVSTTAPTC